MDKKVSELLETIELNDEDILMILQSGQNKKIKAINVFKNINELLSNLENTINKMQDNIEEAINIQRASVTLESTVNANTNYTIPLSYQVGSNSLEVYYCSTKLQKRNRLQRNRQHRRSI